MVAPVPKIYRLKQKNKQKIVESPVPVQVGSIAATSTVGSAILPPVPVLVDRVFVAIGVC